MGSNRNQRRSPRGGRRGFTLMEAALVTVIVGLGVVAMMELLATGTSANGASADLTTAIHLARNIREMSLGLQFADRDNPTHWGRETGESLATFDDLDDLDGQVFSPPIDARRTSLISCTGWSQSVKVETVDLNRLTGEVPDGSTPVNRVTVTVMHRGTRKHELSWLVVDAAN